MAVVAIKAKLMPESLDINLDEIKAKAEEKMKKIGGMNVSFSEEDVAFGLKALIVTLALPEEKDTSIVESELADIDGVSSAQIIDYRRAFG